MLAAAGDLDESVGGSLLTTTDNDYVTNDQSGNAAQYNAHRRSIYLPVIRNALFDMFQAFDVGDPSMVNAHRATTTVASQALYVMNSPFVIDQAHILAKDLLALSGADDARRLQEAYARCFSRAPTADEVTRLEKYVSLVSDRLAPHEPELARRRLEAWANLCQILFASNEFIYVN
jgi:hypothetical protein